MANYRRRIVLACFGLFINQMVGIDMYEPYSASFSRHQLMPLQGSCTTCQRCLSRMLVKHLASPEPSPASSNLCSSPEPLPALRLDQMGRRKTLIAGCAGLSICMLLIAALLSQKTNESASIGAVALLTFSMLISGASVSVAPWVHGQEILLLEARTRGSVSSHWKWYIFYCHISHGLYVLKILVLTECRISPIL